MMSLGLIFFTLARTFIQNWFSLVIPDFSKSMQFGVKTEDRKQAVLRNTASATRRFSPKMRDL
ncbi:hypothetical protein A3F65_03990 [Candidatus Saccharibacteria bacterium RIFCSPHIGHO2_12_FULL_47_16b]|nr:MAG: hypothetical protein A3F65_03990 [Candidatus Saccharibacteria bacterium RIFCSPHIGHO2_12_FULL_47_16b]OGL39400.1 MAG: hypothetical protein A3J32_00560 [Candidatus Saccharibacteria bacterium RIFCSPLOWO2_02_FULL_46_7]